MISFISKDKEGAVTTFDEQRHDLEDGDYVMFSEVKGMTEINGHEFKIKVLGNHIHRRNNLIFCKHIEKYLKTNSFNQ